MALKLKASFAGGELDPALQERITLQKFDSGLKTGRNIIIGKTGRIISRPSRKLFIQTKNANERCILYYPPGSGLYLEWGHEYVRIYAVDAELTGVNVGTLIDDLAHSWTEDDLDNIHFDYSDFYVYAFCTGKAPLKLFPFPGAAFVTSTMFDLPTAPTTAVITEVGGPTGYEVDYAMTIVKGGQESLALQTNTAGYNLPIAAGTSITVACTVGATASLTGSNTPTEMRVYRRPRNGGAFGYIGSSTYFGTSGANTTASFTDIGQAADYTNSPPTLATSVYTRGGSMSTYLATTGTFYQKRLLLAVEGSILGSRTGYPNNFSRDYPLSDDSALDFKAGSSGTALIKRLIDSDGLVAFTNVGVYLHSGQLGPTNLALDKKGDWIIDTRVPPLSIPGGVLFIDKATNVVRCLNWNTDYAAFAGDELSVFSDHLFQGKQVVSWAFQQGDTPVLWAVFEDGTFASFTYERGQEMRAWTRHDCSNELNVEYVAGMDVLGKALFLVEKDGVRYVEMTVPRYVSASLSSSDPESDKNESAAFMDSLVSWSSLMNDDLNPGEEFELEPTVADDWEQELTLTCETSALFPNTADNGAVGTVFRFFNPDDGSTVNLTVTARTSDDEVTVMPDSEFPEEYANGFRLYRTKSTFDGLDHMEGEYPAVMVDGYVVTSPNNNHEQSDYPTAQVVGGELELPASLKGAIVHIGRPITADIETLDIDSVEQRPVFIESQTVNKVYVKLHKSRGLYVGNRFPDDDKVQDETENGIKMSEINAGDEYDDGGEDAEVPGNRYIAPVTQRFEVTIPGDWASNGRVALRHVDCDTFEVLSIIPDTTDIRRS